MENIDTIRKNIDKPLRICSNRQIAKDVYEMVLSGDTSLITAPGQFLNIQIPGLYLRRPISICDYDSGTVTIIYKVVGKGTKLLADMSKEDELMCLMGLGNGFDISATGDHILLVGGGVGTPPMYCLAKTLLMEKKRVTVVLGFNSAEDVFYVDEFRKLGKLIDGSDLELRIATVDGSQGKKGFVTDCLDGLESISDYCACGPMPMLKALYGYYEGKVIGQLSFEERMGCGFGACVGCSINTKSGFKKVCKDGPVFFSTDVVF